MKKNKSIITVLLSVVMLLFCAAPAHAENRPIGVYLDGRLVDFGITNGKKVQALTIYDYAYVPVAKIVEILTGRAPDWNDSVKTASFVYNGKSISIDTRKSGIYINNVFVESVTGTPPVIVNDRTLIPLKMLTGAMGFGQSYEASTHTVWLTTPAVTTPTPTPTPTPAQTQPTIFGASLSKDTIALNEAAVLTVKTNSAVNYVWVNYDGSNNAATYQSSDSSGSKIWTLTCYPTKSQNMTVYAGLSQALTGASSKSVYVAVSAVSSVINSVTSSKNPVSSDETVTLTVKTNSAVNYIWVSYDNISANASHQSTDSSGVKTWTVNIKPSKTQTVTVYANAAQSVTGAAIRNFDITVNTTVTLNSASVSKSSINADETVTLTVKTNSAASYVWIAYDSTTVNASHQSTDASGVKTWTVTLKPAKTQTMTAYANTKQSSSGAASRNVDITVNAAAIINSVTPSKSSISANETVTLTVKTNSAASYVWVTYDSATANASHQSTDSYGVKTWTVAIKPSKTQTMTVYANTKQTTSGAAVKNQAVTVDSTVKLISTSASRTTVSAGDSITVTAKTNALTNYVWVDTGSDSVEMNFTGTDSSGNKNWTMTYYPQKTQSVSVYAGVSRWGKDAVSSINITVQGESPKIVNASAYPGTTSVSGGYQTNEFAITTNSAAIYVGVSVNGQEYCEYSPYTQSGDALLWNVTVDVWPDGIVVDTIMNVTVTAYGDDGKIDTVTVPIRIIS